MPQTEVLVADIGSTLTKLSAFAGVRSTNGIRPSLTPGFLGQGVARTTVVEGDVVL